MNAKGVLRAGALASVILVGHAVLGIDPTEAVVSGVNGRIAYVGFDWETGDTDLYTMNANGTGIVRITTDGQSKGNPQWSPDGTRIAFDASAISDAGSCCSLNIYTVNADSTDRRRLTDTLDTGVGRNFGATWAPSGTWLAFVSTRGESGGFEGDAEIYRMNADGSNPTQLTATDARTSDEEPSVSPDGTRIAFASNRGDTLFGTFDVYVMGADGGNVTRLTTDGAYAYPTAAESRQPVWSPDGTRIAFESTRNGNFEIWVMNADGSNPVNVSNHPSYDADPTWSPDGTQLLFTSLRDGQYDVWAVDAPASSGSVASTLRKLLGPSLAFADTAPRNLTAATGVEAQSPSWQGLPAAATYSFTVKPTALYFGPLSVGTSRTLALWVRNKGTTSLPITAVGLRGTDRAMFRIANRCPATLAPATSCAVRVTFKPTSLGSKTAKVRVEAGAGQIRRIPLSGTGTSP